MGSFGVPPCPIDLRLDLISFSILLFLDLGNLSTQTTWKKTERTWKERKYTDMLANERVQNGTRSIWKSVPAKSRTTSSTITLPYYPPLLITSGREIILLTTQLLISRWWRWWFQIFFYFHPYLGKWSNLTSIFQMGWNHHLIRSVFNIIDFIFVWMIWNPHPDKQFDSCKEKNLVENGKRQKEVRTEKQKRAKMWRNWMKLTH